jgi:RHS repeat-associated protein
MRACTLPIVIAMALCLLSLDAQAQTVQCPTGSPEDPTFFGTGNWCATLQLVWPGPCGCTDATTYYMPCTPAGHGGAVRGGAIGCEVFCSYPESDTPCRPDMEGLGTPPRQPEPAPPQACTSAGLPVSVTTGEMFFTHTDAQVGELVLTRTYNSARAAAGWRYGRFGPGWNASLEVRLRVMSAKQLELRLEDGTPIYYIDADGDGTFAQDAPRWNDSTVTSVSGGYERVPRAGGSESYDAQGRLLTATDTAGVATTYTYDAAGRLISVTRRGRTLVLAYDGSATAPARVLGPDNMLLAAYSYEAASGRLAAVDYADGSGYRYGYDAAGRIVWVRDAADRPVEAHSYDAQGRALTSEIGAGRERLTFSYGTNQTTVTDALGNATTYEWASVQHVKRVTKVTGPCASCGSSTEMRQWTYDGNGRVSGFTQDAHAWSYSYDEQGHMLTETDPLGRVTSYAYDPQGRVTSTSRPGGGSTVTTYGSAGPLTITEAVTATASRTTSMTYTAQGQLQTLTDARGKLTTFTYNATGDLASITDPLGHATTFSYDALGRRTSTTDALGHSTTTSYDSRGRVTRVTQADGTHSDISYDRSGRRTATVDPAGQRRSYVYDEWGQLTQVVDPLAQATSYGYDLMGRLTSLTDAKGQQTRFEYDAAGRVVKTIDPGGGQELFTYDGLGRLQTKTDRKGIVTTYGYDVLGRLTGKSYSDGTTPAVSYTYDLAGRLATAANGTDTLTWTYDLAGQLVSEQSSKNASVVAYTYDLGGNRLTLSLDGTLFVSYAYDDASRLTSITRSGQVFGFSYDAANRRTSMTYPNGVNTSYSYDSLNRLLHLGAVKGAGVITDFVYTYDAAGNRLSKAQTDYTEDYTYDALYRLTGVDRTGAASGPKLWRYAYDAVGNRLTGQTDSTVVTSTYNERNQLLASTGGGALRVRGMLDEPSTVVVNGQAAQMKAGHVFEAEISASVGVNTFAVQATDTSGNTRTKSYQVTVTGSTATYGYDANGSLVTKVEGGHAWAYEWNAEGQLKRVTKDGAEVARYAYDPLGRRVEKVVGGVTTSFSYDGNDVHRQIVGVATFRYVHGLAMDEPLAVEDAVGALIQEHVDALGSIVKRTDSTGAVVSVRDYDAYGQLRNGPAMSGYSYTGREWDNETTLFYYRARYYESTTGRFLGEDPIDLAGGINQYTYAKSNPVRWRDPLGLQAGATACCDGRGGYATCWKQDPDAIPPMLRRCVEEHEADHGRFWERYTTTCTPAPDACTVEPSCRHACTNAPAGRDAFPVPARAAPQVKRDLECSGYAAEIRCLWREVAAGGDRNTARARVRDLVAISRVPRPGWPNGWQCTFPLP